MFFASGLCRSIQGALENVLAATARLIQENFTTEMKGFRDGVRSVRGEYVGVDTVQETE